MKLRFLAASIVLLVGYSLITHVVSADTRSSINATIKISICGNGIIEGGEDCEGNNLNGKSCKDLGFGGGKLSCDVSCSFDTSKCVHVTPTPTPIPSANTNSDNGNSSTSETANKTEDITSTPIPTIIPPKIVSLPVLVQLFGDKKSDTIPKVQLRTVLSEWVNSWKQANTSSVSEPAKQSAIATCDANYDGTCDIKDFSILLFYTQ